MRSKHLVTSVAILAALAVGPGPAHATVCNGHSELCDRKYSNVTVVGAHNSPFVGRDVADNQELSLTQQLALGVRFLQAQTHQDEGTIRLCHSECFIRDAGSLEDLLTPMKHFMDAHPSDVVTLLLTNPDAIDASEYDAVFKRAGLDQYAFEPEGDGKVDQWPTLGDMVNMGRRLVVFMDSPAHNPVRYLISEFDNNIIETPFEYTDLLDLAYCPVDRPAGAGPENGMLLMNHWLQNNDSGILDPNRSMANITNSEAYLRRHVGSCKTTLGKVPTFILLDWVHVGDALLVQDAMNGLSPRTAKQDFSFAPQLAGGEEGPGDPHEPRDSDDADGTVCTGTGAGAVLVRMV